MASKRHCTVSFALSSILWSKFKSAEKPEKAEMAFILLQKRGEEEEEEEEEENEEEVVVAVVRRFNMLRYILVLVLIKQQPIVAEEISQRSCYLKL